MNRTIYTLVRFAIGISMFAHGLVRLLKLEVFSAGMIDSFQKSILPMALVKPFSFALPILEFTIGVLLIIGLLTKPMLITACLLMTVLIFGSATIENWDAINSQLIHFAFFATLLVHIKHNKIAIDYLIRKNRND